MTKSVRLAKEGDIPAIMELLKQVNRVHYVERPDLFKPATKYTVDELREILGNEQTPVFVCVDKDDRVLGHGFCILQRPENTKLLRDILTMYIDDICVDEAARGHQVGTAIYDHILSYARKCGC